MAKLLGAAVVLAGALAVGCATGHAARTALSSPAATRQPTSPATPRPGGHGADDAGRSPMPSPKPVDHCAANRAKQLVLVDLSDQHAWLCAGRRTVYSTAVTTGMATPDTRTPTGRYHIQGRNRNSVLTLENGERYHVKYWIPFDAPMFGFHDSAWQSFPYGSAKYRTSGSHGCVHMPLAAMAFLYRWAKIGADVDIRA